MATWPRFCTADQDMFPGTLLSCDVTATHLKIMHLQMKFTGTWHPNELQWLDYMIGCQPLVLVMLTMVICSINSLPYDDIDHRHGSTLLQVMATSPVLQTHNECNAIVGHVPSWLSGPHLSWLSGPHLSWLSGPHLSWLSGPHSGQLPLYLLSS